MPERVSVAGSWAGEDAVVHSESVGSASRDAVRAQERVGWRHGAPVGWSLTDADVGVLVGLARYGCLTWAQCRDFFYGGATSTASKRLGYLERSGLVRSDTSFDRQWGKLYTATWRGCEFAAQFMFFPLSPYVLSGKDLTHMLAVADVMLRFEADGLETLSEREVRYAERVEGNAALVAERLLGDGARSATDMHNRERFLCVPIVGSLGKKSGSRVVHYPDGVVMRSGRMCAVEVEVTVKDSDRVRETLRSYVRYPLFGEVLWLGTNDVVRQLRGGPAPRGSRRGRQEGALQRLGFATADSSSWKGPDAAPDGDVSSGVGLFCVDRLDVNDEGVRFELDMRDLPPGRRLSKSVWRIKRHGWLNDEAAGAARGVPFARWLVDVDSVVEERIIREREYARMGGDV